MEKTKLDPFIPLPLVPTVLVGAMVDGKPNYLAVGFVSGVNIKPPVIAVSLNRKHHTVRGLLEQGTFSVNVPSETHMRATDYCGLASGRTADKSGIFTTFFGELGTAPMIEDFPIVCECRYTGQRVDFAMDTVFFGEVVRSYVDRDLYRKGEPADILRINPLMTGLDRQYRLAGRAVGKSFSIGWEYLSAGGAKPEGEAGDGFAIVNRSPKHCLTIRGGSTAFDPAEAIDRIRRYAEGLGASPAEGPFAVREEGLGPDAGVRVGMAFPRALPGQGMIEAGRIPGGRFAQGLHAGPYEGIGRALASLGAFAEQAGFAGTGTSYEFYLNDPAATPPEGLKAMILMPVRRKK
jgi:flavin reductase (DIM6/NTAB) family NADH-FMN oxidoreductase RutF